MDKPPKLAAMALLADLLVKHADAYGQENVAEAWTLARKVLAARPKQPRKPRSLQERTVLLLEMDAALSFMHPQKSRRERMRMLEAMESQRNRHFEPGSLSRNLRRQQRAFEAARKARIAQEGPAGVYRRALMVAKLQPPADPDGDT